MSLEYRKILEELPFKDAQWVGIREVREVTSQRYVRDGRPEINETSDTHGVMVEVLIRGQFGYAATPERDRAGVIAAAEAARRQALAASERKLFDFTASVRPRAIQNYRSPVERAFDTVSAGEINGLLLSISERMKVSSKIVRTEAFVRQTETYVKYVDTNGSDGEQEFSLLSSDFRATAQEGSIIQTRTDSGMRGRSYQGGWESLMTPDLMQRADLVAEQALELAAAPECPTETTSLVLMPDQMMLQIHESIGHPLEVDRILGDERNYAGWSFVKPADFGNLTYGSKLLNVTFDPTLPHEFASYAFDDQGAPATKEYLIRDGVLVRGLGGLESQVRSGIPGVANARASSWNRAPIDRMANINLEAGTSSFDQIIGSVENGVMMESNRSWSIDDFRNKFQFGCEYARKIENGKLGAVVRDSNYRGVTLPFWKSLAKVGDSSTVKVFGTPNCGKGEPNQAIRVGHASPVCLFENVEVFGGGK